MGGLIGILDLILRLKELDSQTLYYLKNNNIRKTKDNNLEYLNKIENLICEFNNKEIPLEAKELLLNKLKYLNSILQDIELEESNTGSYNNVK